MSAVHAEASSGRPECGQTGLHLAKTDDWAEVTCLRCIGIRDLRERLAQPSALEQDGQADPQEVAVDQERRFTVREALAFIGEGDLEAAIFRMQRGYARQVRLAGLDRAVRESLEQEKEYA